MKNSYKFLFFSTLMIGTLITISSTSWFSVWMGLEINLLSFIPLMMSSKNLFSTESSLKYFLVQALASIILLFSILIFFLFFNSKIFLFNNFNILISFSMLMKSGMAPMHFWFPSVMEGLSWMNSMILISWQKIAPLMIFSYCMNFNLLIFVIMFSMIFGSLGGFNQTSLRKLIAFSSINHMGWMVSGMMFSESMWMIYFLIYVIINFSIIFTFLNFNIFFLNQTFLIFNLNLLMKFIIFFPLLSLGGLPPFLGFFPKWMIIETLMNLNIIFLLCFMIFFTLITLFFYLRICYSMLLMNFSKMNWNFKTNYYLKNFKTLIFISMLSIWGFMFINIFYLIN